MYSGQFGKERKIYLLFFVFSPLPHHHSEIHNKESICPFLSLMLSISVLEMKNAPNNWFKGDFYLMGSERREIKFNAG